jgi:transcription elongation factor GreA
MKRPMTPYGYSLLRRDLLKMKSMRPELAQAIEVARAHGDLSENADYDAAKERSGMIEAKIRDVQAKLANCEVIDPSQRGEIGKKVFFGVAVEVEDIDSGEKKRVTIVGADESDTARGFLSLESPFGKALIGKVLGDIAKVQAPGGTKEYEILSIHAVDWEAEVKKSEAETKKG